MYFCNLILAPFTKSITNIEQNEDINNLKKYLLLAKIFKVFQCTNLTFQND